MKNHASNGSSLGIYMIMFFSCVVLFSARVLLHRSVETVKTVVWCSNVINGPKNCMLVRLIFLLYQRIGMCPGQTTINKVTELLNRLTPNRARRCRPAQTPLIVWWSDDQNNRVETTVFTTDHQPAQVCLRHVPFALESILGDFRSSDLYADSQKFYSFSIQYNT